MDRTPRDSRQRYTKECLYKAFLDMAETRPVSDISVVELCERAGVSRKTFYKYYTDPFALLAAMQDDLFADYHDLVAALPRNIYAIAPELIRFAGAHPTLLRAAFANRGPGNFIDRMIDDLFATYEPDWRAANPTMQPEQVEMLFHFVVNGMVGVVQRWLTHHPEKAADDIIAEGTQLMLLTDLQNAETTAL